MNLPNIDDIMLRAIEELKTIWKKNICLLLSNSLINQKLYETNKLDKENVYHEDDISIKLFRPNEDLFSHFTCHNLDNSLLSSSFPRSLKAEENLPKHK